MTDFPFLPSDSIAAINQFPSVGDFNNDGLVDLFGTINNGDGSFSSTPIAGIASILANYPGRVHRDARAFDIDGDGNLDVFWNVYSDSTIEDSFSLILYGDGTGGFNRLEERPDVDGFGETIVVADFNNDGWSDLFSPVYTHVLGTDANYLLFNQNGILGSNAALEWGVALSNQPGFLRVEGAQGVDINFDGWIDLFTSSHLYINQQTHFSEMVLAPQVFDEGSCLFDYDNDGDFDLALRTEFGGVKLYDWTGSGFVYARDLTLDADTPGVGLKAYDIDSNGWEDLVLSSTASTTVLLNQGGIFEAVAAATVRFDSFAFADFNQDRRADLVGGTSAGGVQMFNNNSLAGESIHLSLVGVNGELNQHGRSLRLTSGSQPDLILARSIESGSGYLSQSQYETIIGLPAPGVYYAEVALASGPFHFTLSAGQSIQVFADGRVAIEGSASTDIIGGGSGPDLLSSGDGTDSFIGSSGNDIIDGGPGVDSLSFANLDSAIDANLANGTIQFSTFMQAVSNVESIVGTDYNDRLTGDAFDNTLSGGSGNDILEGSGGGDNLSGGTGDDLYRAVDIADLVLEEANAGVDTVETDLASYTLPDQVEHVVATSLSPQTIVGNMSDNRFSSLNGGHAFTGLDGDDVFIVQAGDMVIETEFGGDDRIETSLTLYVLPDNVETLIGTAPIAQDLHGNILDNFLQGGIAVDSLVGLGGNDIYAVGSGDRVIEAIGEGIDLVVTSLTSYALPDSVENLTGTSSSAQSLQGNDLDNIIRGSATGNLFAGGAGNDVYFVRSSDRVWEAANAGFDLVITSLATYTLTANVENLTGTGTSGQKLVGNSEDNVIVGSLGVDTLIGRGGNDTYYVNDSRDFVDELVSEGHDLVLTSVSYSLAGRAVNAEDLIVSDPLSSSALFLQGNSLDNMIIGSAGDDELDGSLGADILTGLGGNDVYIVDSASDQIVEGASNGIDHVVATVNYTLATNVSVEVLRTQNNNGTNPFNLTGNNLVNTVIGNAGNNFLDGGGGNDQLFGLGGDDTYVVDNIDDLISEQIGMGQDRVLASISYRLPADEEIERLEALDPFATSNLVLTGNSFANQIIGNAGNNELDGGGGADLLSGRAGNDAYVIGDSNVQIVEMAGEGTDEIAASVSYILATDISVEVLRSRDALTTDPINLTGNNLVNTVIGNAGDNILDGGGGNDQLQGLGGNDTYLVDSANDLVFEGAGQGEDRIKASTFYQLRDNQAVEVLETNDSSSTAAIGLTGNNLVNTVIGNAGNNILDGGGGADTLSGLAGNDVYVIDDFGDQIVETANGGTDRVAAMVSYTLQQDVAVETLGTRNNAGTDPINLTGNNLVNIVIGNAGDNILDGSGGNDQLYGLGGNDRIVQSSLEGRDFIDGGVGTDTYQLDGDPTAETFTIYTRAAAFALVPALPGIANLNGATEIVITRTVAGLTTIISELDNIEEIMINTLDVSANDGNGAPNGGGNGGDTINIVGDFTQTSLDYSTITIDGTSGNDIVDISQLASAHRIVFRQQGGSDTIVGTLRPQDMILNADGSRQSGDPNIAPTDSGATTSQTPLITREAAHEGEWSFLTNDEFVLSSDIDDLSFSCAWEPAIIDIHWLEQLAPLTGCLWPDAFQTQHTVAEETVTTFSLIDDFAIGLGSFDQGWHFIP
jgi:Ca2+-binding RTX toxin-like protein